MDSLQQIKITRDIILKTTSELSEEQLLKIPDNFNNNILWHMGHLAYVSEALTYKLSGQDTYLSADWETKFGKNSSPKDWESNPNIQEVKTELTDTINRIMKDIETDKFNQYKEYKTALGVTLSNINDGLAFLAFHESLHLGYIMAQKHVL